MSNRAATRADDDELLDLLARVLQGEPLRHISRSMGRTDTYASTMLARVRAADLRESGEPARVVMAGYQR